uniref:Uncharacterized protein n=1 Tax=Fervidicoccus fontis TaxID=683846 RepID=A0A7J3ZJS2_9CREN
MGTRGGSTSRLEELRDDVVVRIVRKLEGELRKAFLTTTKKDSNWVNIKNAYMLALSLRRLLEKPGCQVASKRPPDCDLSRSRDRNSKL